MDNNRVNQLVEVGYRLQVIEPLEPVFVNDYGAQELIPRNRFRQLMFSGGPFRQIGYRTGPPGWESIPGLLKMFTNTGSASVLQRMYFL